MLSTLIVYPTPLLPGDSDHFSSWNSTVCTFIRFDFFSLNKAFEIPPYLAMV